MSTHTYTHMGSINISLKREAYEFLRALKTRDKSFSDVVLEFKEKKEDRSGKSLLKYAGVLEGINIDWNAKEKRMRAFRESFNKRTEETRKKNGVVET